MTFLEMLPIALAICLWHKEFHKKKILFLVDNMAVVSILKIIASQHLKPNLYLEYKTPH
jgi:hypothetical protein